MSFLSGNSLPDDLWNIVDSYFPVKTYQWYFHNLGPPQKTFHKVPRDTLIVHLNRLNEIDDTNSFRTILDDFSYNGRYSLADYARNRGLRSLSFAIYHMFPREPSSVNFRF